MSTTFQQFIAFILASPPETELNHFRAYSDCAVGMFAVTVGGTSSDVYEQIRRTQPSMPHVRFPGYLFYDDVGGTSSSAMLMDTIDASGLMHDKAPTMGHLVEFIKQHFPSVLEDAA